jgi:hypothetical protein
MKVTEGPERMVSGVGFVMPACDSLTAIKQTNVNKKPHILEFSWKVVASLFYKTTQKSSAIRMTFRARVR